MRQITRKKVKISIALKILEIGKLSSSFTGFRKLHYDDLTKIVKTAIFRKEDTKEQKNSLIKNDMTTIFQCAGEFLSSLLNLVDLPYLSPMLHSYVRKGEIVIHKLHSLNDEIWLCLLLNIYGKDDGGEIELPNNSQIFYCGSTTTKDALELFLKRTSMFKSLPHTIIGANELSTVMKEIVLSFISKKDHESCRFHCILTRDCSIIGSVQACGLSIVNGIKISVFEPMEKILVH